MEPLNHLKELSLTTKQIRCFFIFPLIAVVFATIVTIYLHVTRTDYINIQVDWFLSINHFLSQWPLFWLNMTQLGDAFVLIPIMSLLLIRQPNILAALFGAVPLAAIVSSVGKKLFAVPRPAATLDHDLFTIVGSAVSSHTSLPSGHTITIFTAMTVFIVGTLLQNNTDKKKMFVLIFGVIVASMVALSRVAVGAHWPLDLILGAILGVISGFSGIILTQKYTTWWGWMKNPKYKLIVIAILLLFIGSLLSRMVGHHTFGLFINWVAVLSGFITIFYLFLSNG